ncbi:galectin-2-like [Megalops cyprinoides]|uniref:galectin-2-like n=1 Tax=Megalops cyprinoides TaxID=118141 RepID=UPI001864B1CE|nr:galectin-2-like [Megalops cyprinoides]
MKLPVSLCDQELELRNVTLRAGDKLKVKGKIPEDAERFQIDLGCDSSDLALHFNPRFHDEDDGKVIVCNSLCEGCWGYEQRDAYNPFHRGSNVTVTVKVTEEGFEVELPEGHEIRFPDRRGLETLTYVRVKGHFKFTSFKIC